MSGCNQRNATLQPGALLVTPELAVRDENSSSQLSFDITSSYREIGAQFEAAGSVFANALQVAEKVLPSRRDAVQFAIRQTKRITGIDWMHELQVRPERTGPNSNAASVTQFLSAWKSGELSLPWAPALCTDTYSAFLGWQMRNKAAGSVPMRQFAFALKQSGEATNCRKRWRDAGATAGPAAFLIPNGCSRPVSQFEMDWLGDCVTAFRKAAGRAGLIK